MEKTGKSGSHIAFRSVMVLDKLQQKIEVIEIFDSQLLVGTSEGILFHYEVKKNEELKEDSENKNISLIDVQKEFVPTKKPILQLTALENQKILLSLADNIISVHDLPSFSLRTKIVKSRDCHLYAVDNSKVSPRICIAIKKKLLIFTWNGVEFHEWKELSLPDSAKTLVWCGDSLCIGFKREYTLINVKTGAMTELFPVGKTGNPLVTLLPNEQILLSRDNVSIFIGYDGKPTRTYGLSWSEIPVAMGYCFPYILAVLNRFIEIRVVSDSQDLLQTLPLKGARFLVTKDNIIYVAGSNTIWKLIPVPLIIQVEHLVKEREYSEALTLCDYMPESQEKRTKRDEIKLLYTYHLFSEGQYDQAITYFMELDCDPIKVIGLYNNLLPKSVQSAQIYPIHVTQLSGSALDKALNALSRFLKWKRPDIISKATNNDLVATEFHDTKDLGVIIDTCLLKCFIKTNDPNLLPFLKGINKCHIKETEETINSYKRYAEGVEFFKAKGLHQKAIALLSNESNGFKVQDVVKYLQELGKEHSSLIFKSCEWIFQNSPEEGLKVFTQRPKDKALPSHEVLAFIKKTPKASSIVVPFLEHIIHINHEIDPEFHNELIFSYYDTIMVLKKKYISKPGERAGTEQGLLGETRKKLLAFLQSSKFYTPEKMLSKFPFEDLFEERAILLGRISQHDKALHIYAHKLKDFQAAERYCISNYSEKEESRDVFYFLLKTYLQPGDDIKPLIQPALDILNKYYKKIDMSKALQLLPEDIKIKDLPVFENVLRDYTSQRRTNQIVKNLLKSENLQVREQLMNVRSKYVRITESSICPQCSKRIGDSVCVAYPNGTIVHYICYTKLEDAKK